MTTWYKAKYISISARLRRSNFANFYDYYHTGDAKTDHFYKALSDAIETHIVTNQADMKIFRSPMTTEGFYFKSDDIRCTDINKKPCLIENCFDYDVTITGYIRPYNFIKDSKQFIGVSIIAKAIKVKKDKI